MRCLKPALTSRHTALLWGLTGWTQREWTVSCPVGTVTADPPGASRGPHVVCQHNEGSGLLVTREGGRLAAGECYARILWASGTFHRPGLDQPHPGGFHKTPAVPHHLWQRAAALAHDRDPEDGAPLEAHKNGHANGTSALAPRPALTAASASRSKPNGMPNVGIGRKWSRSPCRNRSAPQYPMGVGQDAPGLPYALLLCPHHSDDLGPPMNEYSQGGSLHYRTRFLDHFNRVWAFFYLWI